MVVASAPASYRLTGAVLKDDSDVVVECAFCGSPETTKVLRGRIASLSLAVGLNRLCVDMQSRSSVVNIRRDHQEEWWMQFTACRQHADRLATLYKQANQGNLLLNEEVLRRFLF